MQTLSAFQLLPPHIVKQIVNHVAFSSRLLSEEFDDDHCQDGGTHTRLQTPLLWVCHNFRAYVYVRFCRRYRLDILSSDEKPSGWPDLWPHCHLNPDNHTHHVAKQLNFQFDAWAVYSGKALELMSMAPFEGCPFPQVRVLMITLLINPRAKDSDDDSSSDDGYDRPPTVFEDYPEETTANTTAFVRRLKQMAPDINRVYVKASIGDFDEVLLENCSTHDMELARQLFGIADNMVAITPGCAPLVMYMDMEPIRNLVHLDIDIEGYTDVIVPVIRRSTQTLQTLAVNMGGLAGITGLIQDTGVGKYLEYPCLHKLELYPSNYSRVPRMPVFPGAVPFPNLRHLTLQSKYPFGDDVVFRGNAATLAYLDMRVDVPLMFILCEQSVFTPTSHPRLHCVIIDSLERRSPLEFAAVPAYISLVSDIGTEAPVREFGMPKYGYMLLAATSLHSKLAYIQDLSLTRTRLDLWDLFALLKLLPLLSDLTTLAPVLGDTPTGVTKASLPNYIVSNYAPMAKRFRSWCFVDNWFGDYSDMVMCVVLVALACPNFDYAAPRPGPGKYKEKLEEVITSREFKKHESRLRRLVFHIPDKR